MNHQRLSHTLIVIGCIGMATAAKASVIQQCMTVSTVTGQDCFTAGIACYPDEGSCGPDHGCDVDCDVNVQCNPTSGNAEGCSMVQVPSTPIPIYRSYNSTTHKHQYRTDGSVASGFASEGIVFQLANDGYNGAIAFPPTPGMDLFYVPNSTPTALPYTVPVYRWNNPYRGDDLWSLNPNAAASLPCSITGNPMGPPTIDCWEGGYVAGYVGLPCGTLAAGTTKLGTNQGVTSCDGRFHLVMQDDGNLVLYQDSAMAGGPQTALWATNTWGTTGQFAEFNYNGQLQVFDANGNVIWQDMSATNGGSRLMIQNDGNVVIYAPGAPYQWTAIWSSGTGGH